MYTRCRRRPLAVALTQALVNRETQDVVESMSFFCFCVSVLGVYELQKLHFLGWWQRWYVAFSFRTKKPGTPKKGHLVLQEVMPVELNLRLGGAECPCCVEVRLVVDRSNLWTLLKKSEIYSLFWSGTWALPKSFCSILIQDHRDPPQSLIISWDTSAKPLQIDKKRLNIHNHPAFKIACQIHIPKPLQF